MNTAINELWDNYNEKNIYVSGILEREGSDKTEKYLRKYYQNLLKFDDGNKHTDTGITKNHSTRNIKKTTPRHIIITYLKHDRKVARKNKNKTMYRRTKQHWLQIPSCKPYKPKTVE